MSRSNAEDSNQIPGALGVKHPGNYYDFYGSGFDTSGSESSSDSSSSGSASPLSPEKSAPVKKVSSTGIGASSDSRDVLNPTLVESAIASAIDSVKSAIVQNKKAGESIDALTVLNDKEGRDIANLQAISKQTDKKLSQRKAVSKSRKRVAKSRDQPSTKPTRKGKKTNKLPKARKSPKSLPKSSKRSKSGVNNAGGKRKRAKSAARPTTETNRELDKLRSDMEREEKNYDDVNRIANDLKTEVDRYAQLEEFLNRQKEKAVENLDTYNTKNALYIQTLSNLKDAAEKVLSDKRNESSVQDKARLQTLTEARNVHAENVRKKDIQLDSGDGDNVFGLGSEEDNMVPDSDAIKRLVEEQRKEKVTEAESIKQLENDLDTKSKAVQALDNNQTKRLLENKVRLADEEIKTAAKKNKTNLEELERVLQKSNSYIF